MKTALGSTLAIFSLLLCVHAQEPDAPPRRHSLRMEARSLTRGGTTETQNNMRSSRGGSYGDSKTFTRTTAGSSTVTLEISIKNFLPEADAATLEWFFFSRNLKGGPERLFDSGKCELPVGAGSKEFYRVESKAAQVRSLQQSSFHENVANTFHREEQGERITGWGVRMLVEGKVTDVKGSDRRFETLLRDGFALQKMREE